MYLHTVFMVNRRGMIDDSIECVKVGDTRFLKVDSSSRLQSSHACIVARTPHSYVHLEADALCASGCVVLISGVEAPTWHINVGLPHPLVRRAMEHVLFSRIDGKDFDAARELRQSTSPDATWYAVRSSQYAYTLSDKTRLLYVKL